MKVADIFVALGFDVDDAPLKNFDEKIQGLTSDMWAGAAAAAAAVYAIGAFVEKSIKGAAALRDFNLQTGLAQDKLQKWQIVGQLADLNLSAETVTGSIKNLQKSINDVRWGTGDGNAFKWLGVDIMHGQDAFAVLEQLRDKLQLNLQRFGRARTVELIQQMGLDPGFINALQLSNAEFEKMYKGKILNQDELDKLNKLGLSLKDLSLEWQYLTAHLTAKFAPALTNIIDWAIPKLEFVFKGIERIGSYLENHQTIFKLVASVLIVAFSELLPITAAVAAALAGILFVLEQIGEYKPKDGGWIDTLITKSRELLHLMQDIGAAIIKASTPNSDWEKVFKPSSKFTETSDDLQNPQKDKERLTERKDLFDGFLNALNQVTSLLVSSLFPLATLSTPAPAQAGNVNFNNHYTIHGATDPQGLSSEISRMQQYQLSNSLESFNNGSIN